MGVWVLDNFDNNLEIQNAFKNTWRRVVDNVQINISPSNIFPNRLLAERFHQNSQVVMAAMDNNGLIEENKKK